MPLEQQTYSENLDVICQIDGSPWNVIEAVVEITRNEKSDYVDFIITPSKSVKENFPDDPTALKENGGLLGTEFTLDVVNDIRTKGNRGLKRIFTGHLANLSPSVEAAWEGIAYDPTLETLESGSSFMSQKIDISKSLVDFDDTEAKNPRAYYVNASTLVENIIEESGVGILGEDAFIHMSEGGFVQGKQGGADIGGIDQEIQFTSYEDKKVSDLLDRLTKSTNSSWWIDRFGRFHFGALRPGNPINSYELQFVIDSSAGYTTPSYNSVQVIGKGVVSEDGWRKSALDEDTPVELSQNVSDEERDSEKLKKPTFTYKNMQIQTQQEADNARKKIINDLSKQTKDGKITVVGFPALRPLDVVKMPNNDVQPFGGDVYGVYKVVHKIGAGDGMKTDIFVEGLSNAQFGYEAGAARKNYPFLVTSEEDIEDNIEEQGLDGVSSAYGE
jgi:hypothetical protein